MERGLVSIYCGEGKGKSTYALGRAFVCAGEGKEVFMIQFLKGRFTGELEYMKRLEPEVKVFRFEKAECYYEELTESAREEEKINILNGVNFAKKVMAIGECDVLILDEILALVDLGIVNVQDLIHMIHSKPDEMEVIMTGRSLPEELLGEADAIQEICLVKG